MCSWICIQLYFLIYTNLLFISTCLWRLIWRVRETLLQTKNGLTDEIQNWSSIVIGKSSKCDICFPSLICLCIFKGQNANLILITSLAPHALGIEQKFSIEFLHSGESIGKWQSMGRFFCQFHTPHHVFNCRKFRCMRHKKHEFHHWPSLAIASDPIWRMEECFEGNEV